MAIYTRHDEFIVARRSRVGLSLPCNNQLLRLAYQFGGLLVRWTRHLGAHFETLILYFIGLFKLGDVSGIGAGTYLHGTA
jgi:hypothetical protein